jgi:hypothetical protein
MKNPFAHLTGIVYLTTILILGGCSQADDPDKPSGDLKKVEIFLKVYVKDGEKHLEMYDSNKPESKVVDDLHTEVEPGTKVVWRRAKDSGIKSMKKVAPVDPGEIFIGDAKTILLNKRFRTRIPNEKINRKKEEKYIIVFVDKEDKEETSIDPYLRIRGTN